MKHCLSILLFCLCLQTSSSAFSLELIPWDCELDRKAMYLSKLEVFRGNSLVPIQTMESGKLLLHDLKLGKYTITFENQYNQIVKQEHSLSPSMNSLKICVNGFVNTGEKTLIGSLEENKRIDINFKSRGRYHEIEEQLSLSYRDAKIYATLIDYSYNIQRKTLSKEEWDCLVEFEQKVRLIKQFPGGCTTTDNYMFLTGNKVLLKVEDRTCMFLPYIEMKKRLFTVDGK
ncbi:MAG: hypothetical protein AAFR61_05765 [Bacteroidota bacterium]